MELKGANIMMSFNEQEDQQSLRRLNNKQKSDEMLSKSIIKLFGYNNKNFEQSIKSVFFFTETKRNFDLTVIISNDPERKQWWFLSLTNSEINWLAKQELSSPLVGGSELLLYTVFQFNPELLLTFKNSTKNYSQINFNYIWVGMQELDDEPILHSNWKLNYT